MTILDFNSQSLDVRADILYEWGFFITSGIKDGVNTVLYAINGFFAEERISVATNLVIDIKAYTLKELSSSHIKEIRSKRGFLLLAPGVMPAGIND